MLLLSDKIILSVSELWDNNPFGHEGNYIVALFNFKFIFIQQVILRDYLSEYQNGIIQNFNKEYNSFLDSKYHYNPFNINLTGINIYDNLKEHRESTKEEKNIIIAPTWIKYIKGTSNLKTYRSIYFSLS